MPILSNKVKKIVGGVFMTAAWAIYTICAIIGTVPSLVVTLISTGLAILGLLGIALVKPEVPGTDS